MYTRPIQIPHDNRFSDAMLYLPKPEDQLSDAPLVIISHGYGGNRFAFESLATFLVEQGFAALNHSFCGGSKDEPSPLPSTQMTLLTEQEDLIAVMEYALSLPWVSHEKLFLFGESQGGMISALVAEKTKLPIAGLLLQYPALCIADNWKERYPDESMIPEEEDFWGLMLGKAFAMAIRDLDVTKATGKYAGPVLIMHGTDDPVVPIRYSTEAAKRYPNATLQIYEGGGHGFNAQEDVRRNAEVLDFLKSHT